MTRALLRVAGIAVVAASLGVLRLAPRTTTAGRPVDDTMRHASSAGREPAPPPDSLLERVARLAPFRSSRRPAAVAYDLAGPTEGAPPPPPVPPKPQPRLSGIVWGAEPAAVLEGIPGLDAPRAFRAGESFQGFRVRRIAPDRVVLSGLDTVWTLTVRSAP